MKKLKLLRNYGGFNKGQIVKLDEKTAYSFLMNTIAILVDCGSDCEECKDCKSKFERKEVVVEAEIEKKVTKKPTRKKAPAKK